MTNKNQRKTYNLPDRFITVPPLLKLKEKKLKYLDALTYAALKTYNSYSAYLEWFKADEPQIEGYCFPAYETIAKTAGISKSTAVSSIKRLEAAGLIKVTRSPKLKAVNHYWFPDLDECFTIPFGLFKVTDLTPNERAMLIVLRQFYIGEDLNCMFTEVISDIAKHLGVTYRTVHCQYIKLLEKGYITDRSEVYKGQYTRRIVKLSDKLNWIFKSETVESIAKAKLDVIHELSLLKFT